MQTPPDGSHLDELVDELVEGGLVSAIVALVGSRDEIGWTRCASAAEGTGGPVPVLDSLFDLASLTKPWMATLALQLSAAGVLPLELALGEIWSGVSRPVADISLDALLRHRSGLQAWAPLYHLCREPRAAQELLLSRRFAGAEAPLYGDLGYILWGFAAQHVLGKSLLDLTRTHLTPLAEPGTLLPSTETRGRAVPCLLDGSREVELAAEQGLRIGAAASPPRPGEVQDGNARFLGGLAGHAGLFASARALWDLGRLWLAAADPLDLPSVRQALSGGGPFAAGWMRRDGSESSGRALSPASFGHTGFTGGSLWIEPDVGKVMVLLAHRTSIRTDLDAWRRRFHRLALEG